MFRGKLALVRRPVLFAHREKRSLMRASEVAVQFKDIPQILFNANAQQPQPPNVLALRIQPEEGLSLRIVSRVPGTRAQTHPVEMDFNTQRYSVALRRKPMNGSPGRHGR